MIDGLHATIGLPKLDDLDLANRRIYVEAFLNTEQGKQLVPKER
jgi:hypothetical protein